MITRVFFGAALTLLLSSPATAQHAADPTGMPADCMHGAMGTSAAGAHEMAGMAGMGMQGQAMQGPGMQGTMPMPGMQSDAAATPSMGMACGCAECASRAGLAALLGRSIGVLGLTVEQTAELDAVLARAREAALAVLTTEQRTALEAPAAGSAGGCMASPATSGAEAQQQH